MDSCSYFQAAVLVIGFLDLHGYHDTMYFVASPGLQVRLGFLKCEMSPYSVVRASKASQDVLPVLTSDSDSSRGAVGHVTVIPGSCWKWQQL